MAHYGSNKIMSKEFEKLVFEAMNKLTHQDRAILSLRYIEGMCFSEIAYVFDRSHLGAYISLFKAKRFFKKQLASAGFRKGFLPAISLFGKLTTDRSTIASVANMRDSRVKLDLHSSEEKR